jgi:arylsulfatase A-like enzyme
VLTSQYPVTHGVRKNGLRLEDGAVTLAHVLARNGWTCAAALANSASARWPGFHRTFGVRGGDRRTTDAARAWIREHVGRPFFLWVHLFAPHRPYRPAPELAERFDPGYVGPIDGSLEQTRRISEKGPRPGAADRAHLVALYDGEVRTADRLLGEVLAELETAGLERRTLVVLTADHGEELCERSAYVNHSASVYDVVLRVPLAFRWPGRIPRGVRAEGVAEAIDVAPTVLDLLGLEVPERFAGTSLAPALRGEPSGAADPAFSELEDRVVTVRTPRFRYVDNPGGRPFPLSPDDPAARYPIAAEELYALGRDPAERTDVSAARPAEAARLRAIVRAWKETHGWREASRRFRRRVVAPEAAEELGTLGYLP